MFKRAYKAEPSPDTIVKDVATVTECINEMLMLLDEINATLKKYESDIGYNLKTSTGTILSGLGARGYYNDNSIAPALEYLVREYIDEDWEYGNDI